MEHICILPMHIRRGKKREVVDKERRAFWMHCSESI